jgi:hypothetical protein
MIDAMSTLERLLAEKSETEIVEFRSFECRTMHHENGSVSEFRRINSLEGER